MFKRFLLLFSKTTGLAPEELDGLLPAVSGTMLERALELHSGLGGHALWWVLTLVEEVSISIYREMRPSRARLDPLYHEIHWRHFQEEVRHSPYAYLMLENLYRRDRSALGGLFKRTDFLVAQALEVSWALVSLSRLRNAERLRKRHPFYATLARLMPLLRGRSPFRLLRSLFVSAPFVSLLLNPNHHEDLQGMAARLRALEFPLPAPEPPKLGAP